jgi:hypothetical protein
MNPIGVHLTPVGVRLTPSALINPPPKPVGFWGGGRSNTPLNGTLTFPFQRALFVEQDAEVEELDRVFISNVFILLYGDNLYTIL